jgi:NADPH:quinone reductase-like Zn-dependent oxidoreductase
VIFNKQVTAYNRLPKGGHLRGVGTAANLFGRASRELPVAAPMTLEKLQPLAGQTVVVIGGTSGIGLETARRARGEGVEVMRAALKSLRRMSTPCLITSP